MDYDQSQYKVKTWKNLTLLHWILNPGLAVNELVFGQRVPKKQLIDKSSDNPLMERTYVPCPHCKTLHDGRTWSRRNSTAFKNWFGLYCPECGGIIPCLHNATAYLLMVLTFPIWGWFKNRWKQQWLANQAERYKNISFEEIQHSKVSWVMMGLKFGGFMFVFMSLFSIALNPSDYLSILLINIPVWILGGLAFGYTMKYWMGRRGQESASA